MPRRATNVLLLILVLGLLATGILAWLLPVPRVSVLYDAHRALGAALILALVWKQFIVRSSVVRRVRLHRVDASLVVSGLAAAALVASLVVGLAWTAGLLSFDSLWGYSALNIHVFAGLGVAPFLAWHALQRLGRNGRTPLLGRRVALRFLALSVVGLLASPLVARVADLRAGERVRRITGSKHAASFTGNAFPLTSWMLDETPALDASTWRLAVSGALEEPATLSYAELTAHPASEVTAILDCTGGWWSEQRWTGVRVGDLLATRHVHARAHEATVISVTGHRWTFPLEELREALLATHVGGELLSPGHGFPVRLVAPERRGFQWIKWVARIEVA